MGAYFVGILCVSVHLKNSLHVVALLYLGYNGLTQLQCTLEPYHKTVHYKMVFDIRWFQGGPEKCCIQTKMYRLYRKMTINSHFFYIIYTF